MYVCASCIEDPALQKVVEDNLRPKPFMTGTAIGEKQTERE